MALVIELDSPPGDVISNLTDFTVLWNTSILNTGADEAFCKHSIDFLW